MPYFTRGHDRSFERMMRELPNNGHDPDSLPVNRNCRYCLYYNNQKRRCGEKKCGVFNGA